MRWNPLLQIPPSNRMWSMRSSLCVLTIDCFNSTKGGMTRHTFSEGNSIEQHVDERSKLSWMYSVYIMNQDSWPKRGLIQWCVISSHIQRRWRLCDTPRHGKHLERQIGTITTISPTSYSYDLTPSPFGRWMITASSLPCNPCQNIFECSLRSLTSMFGNRTQRSCQNTKHARRWKAVRNPFNITLSDDPDVSPILPFLDDDIDEIAVYSSVTIIVGV